MALFRKNDFFKWAQKIKSVFCFNPHTHEGCDKIVSLQRLLRIVSIHTPTKGVTTTSKVTNGNMQVSIHTPTKGVTLKLRFDFISWRVSIHTPTKGVTGLAVIIWRKFFVSIHTPTKGVTDSAHSGQAPCPCFNPHTHEGCDREYLRVMRPLVVSIHTPTKGVTDRERRYHDIWRVSIHTPTKGVTQDFCDYYKYLKFQSTHPRRV